MPLQLRALPTARARRLLALILLTLGVVLAVSGRASSGSRHGADPTVVAARPIATGTELTAADVRLEAWPRSIRPGGAFDASRAVVGKRTSSALESGEAITATRLVGSGLTTGLAPGLAAIPVAVADSGVLRLIHAGDRVDLLAAPVVDGAGDGDLLASSVLVLAAIAPTDTDAARSGTLVVAADRATELRLVSAGSRKVLPALRPP